jgi:cytochrome P450
MLNRTRSFKSPHESVPRPSPYLVVAKAYARSLWSGKSLPPGKLVHLDHLERADRTLLIDYANSYGPVFKGLMENQLAVCVVGHDLGRRLLKEYAESLRPVSIKLDSLFSVGFMREMQGECHRAYRKQLVNGINDLDFDSLIPSLEKIVVKGLADFEPAPGAAVTGHEWLDVLARITSSLLVCLFFGVRPGQSSFDRLMAAYYRLGPRGVVWHITGEQASAFGELRTELLAISASGELSENRSLLGCMQTQGLVDETMLGNLIYMVEMGRYDLGGLLRWLSRYAAGNADWLKRIAREDGSSTPMGGVSEAFVLEVLRLEQSERLMRNVLKPINFDGFLIPKDTLLRVCMWEAHKDGDAFPQPFVFDPSRFLGEDVPGGRFSPFGLDHHLCPFSALSVSLAALFLRVLASRYDIHAINDGPAVRGPYHWEPPPGFTVSLKRQVVTET